MKIAFISDIHFGKLAISKEYSFEGEDLKDGEIENAKSSRDGLIEILIKEHPQYLFIAGDLTSTGSPLEFEHCYRMINEIREKIGVEKDKVVFCVGNHDIDWRTTQIIDQFKDNKYSKEDKDLLEKQYIAMAQSVAKSILERNNHRDIVPKYKEEADHAFSGVLEYEDCIVFVLNTTIDGSHLQIPKHGHLGTIQFDWFKEKAEKYACSEKPKICLLHHHPTLYPNPLRSLDVSNIKEASEFLAICGNNNISMVLHGHKHQPHALTLKETLWLMPVTLICAGSLSANYEQRYHVIPNTFHIIDYKQRDHIELKNYSYTPQNGWLPTKNDENTPVDDIMLLGRVVEQEEAREIIRRLPKSHEIPYDELDEVLKYMPKDMLNKLFRQEYKDHGMITETGSYYIK